MFFTRGRHDINDLYCISQNYFLHPKNTIPNHCIKIILSEQTPGDIILLFRDKSGLDMNIEEGKQFCREAWGNDYECLQIERLAKLEEDSFIMRSCNKTKYTECNSGTKFLSLG